LKTTPKLSIHQSGILTNPSDGFLDAPNRREWTVILAASLATALLLWISFPPVGAWWLAWLAPVPLIWLVIADELPGKKPYRMIWLSGLIYWLATFYFIPIPHPALWVGWFAVSAYMSIYTPLFVAISRTLVHRFRVPAVIAAPLVWTGLEWIRCNFATGMAMACLSHSQYQQPILIQVADLSGAYTLTFAMVMFAAGVAAATLPKIFSISSLQLAPTSPTILRRLVSACVSLLVIATVVGYGNWRLLQLPTKTTTETNSIRVALIQSSVDTILEPPTQESTTAKFEQIRDLTLAARQKWSDLDLIVWPESSFPVEDLLSDFNETATADYFRQHTAAIWQIVTGFSDRHPQPVTILAGSTSIDPEIETMFNSALLISEPGVVVSRYYKNHRVMLGEYVPFADWFPWLQTVTPIGRGLTAGNKFESFEIGGIRLTPSICFETTIPHLVRHQINQLESAGVEPDAIVNLTNDGWFFGTSCLDFHLACNVFRAVENRKPNLVCANTGLSAEIDAAGRLLQIGPRRETAIMLVELGRERTNSPYRKTGDFIPMLFGTMCVIVFVWNRFR